MFHQTTVGPVLDADDKPIPGKSFHLKGVLESNHAGELLSEQEFRALVVDEVDFSRTPGGGFEYSLEVVVSARKLASIQEADAAAAKAKAEADAAANAAQQDLQKDAELDAAKKAAFEEGRRQAILEQAKAAGAASVVPPKELPPATT